VILGAMGELAAETECKDMVQSLVETPQSPVTFTLTDTRQTQTTTAAGSDILNPPPPSGNIQACSKWVSGSPTQDALGWRLGRALR